MGDEEHDVSSPFPSSARADETRPDKLTRPATKQGASIKEQLIAACRGNNTDLLTEILAPLPDEEIAKLLNQTTTVMGNHLYHEAALRGNCTRPTPEFFP